MRDALTSARPAVDRAVARPGAGPLPAVRAFTSGGARHIRCPACRATYTRRNVSGAAAALRTRFLDHLQERHPSLIGVARPAHTSAADAAP